MKLYKTHSGENIEFAIAHKLSQWLLNHHDEAIDSSNLINDADLVAFLQTDQLTITIKSKTSEYTSILFFLLENISTDLDDAQLSAKLDHLLSRVHDNALIYKNLVQVNQRNKTLYDLTFAHGLKLTAGIIEKRLETYNVLHENRSAHMLCHLFEAPTTPLETFERFINDIDPRIFLGTHHAWPILVLLGNIADSQQDSSLTQQKLNAIQALLQSKDDKALSPRSVISLDVSSIPSTTTMRI